MSELPITTRPQHESEVTQLPTKEIFELNYLWIKTITESKRDLAINQVPITTKPPLSELLHINEVTRSN